MYQNAATKTCSLLVAVMHRKKHSKPLLFISKKRTSLPEVNKPSIRTYVQVIAANVMYLPEISAKPPALQLLLLIPEAIDVSTLTPPSLHPPSPPSTKTDHRDHQHNLSLPNSYLICKLFCAKPHPQTPVQWASSNPQFGIKQVYRSSSKNSAPLVIQHPLPNCGKLSGKGRHVYATNGTRMHAQLEY